MHPQARNPEEGGLLVRSVGKIVHFHVQRNRLIDVVEECFLVERHEIKVVKGLEFLHILRSGLRCCVVVHKPTGDVGIETVGNDVKEILER